ncbi:MAG TPA: cystathionine beta-lyase [Alphaproteobacteria bacterium]|nr:cystathionine beta-lyase [Alphaproteobacteria bacterium]
MKTKHPTKKETLLTTAGRNPAGNFGIVNPPVYHASTVVYPSIAAHDAARKDKFEGVQYGRLGTPTTFAFEEAVAALEGGYRSVSLPSGLSALTTAVLAVVKAGDHVLVSDSVYGPLRIFCEEMLKGLGVEISYFEPLIGAGIAQHLRKNTRLVCVESPGSLTFEVQDVPAIAEAAHAAGALVMIDNTWSAGLYFQPFAHGVDISVQAATKYIAGHSDAMLGVVTTATEAHWRKVKATAAKLGLCAGPDDCYLGLRGIRTLAVRLARHQENGLRLARWLQARPEVARVVHPGLPQDPGHQLWKRDFTGACGLFGVMLKPVPKPAVDAFIDSLELFGLGYSWGGYESLVIPAHPAPLRTATRWEAEGPYLRLHAGLEDSDDQIADLERGFAALHRAA